MAAKKTAKKTAAKATKATPRASKPKTAKVKAPKVKMGRPPKDPSARRTATLGVRLHPAERDEIQAAAEAEKLTVTELLLRAVRAYRAR